MPLDFPNSPTNGQYYNGFVYNSANETWDSAYAPRAATIPSSSPNYIINGAFDINQRNSTSTTASGYVTFDRWSTYQQGGGTTTISAQTFAAGDAPAADVPGVNFVRLITTGYSAASSVTNFTTKIEDVRTLAGQTATLSFWAKAGSGTPKVSVELNQTFGTGGSSFVLTNGGSVTLSTSWQRYSLTIAVPSISGKTFGTGSYLSTDFWVNAGTDFASRTNSIGVQNNTFDFWGVQFESGTAPTNFKRAGGTLQGELAACQRYYYKIYADGIMASYAGIAEAWSGSNAAAYIPFKEKMRVPPTSVDFQNFVSNATTQSRVVTSASLAVYETNSDVGCIQLVVSTGLTTGAMSRIVFGSGTAGIGFSAEL